MKQPERYVEPRLTQYLFDRASRTLTPLSGTFELSPVCNLACKMCYVRKTPAEVAASPRPPVGLIDRLDIQIGLIAVVDRDLCIAEHLGGRKSLDITVGPHGGQCVGVHIMHAEIVSAVQISRDPLQMRQQRGRERRHGGEHGRRKDRSWNN